MGVAGKTASSSDSGKQGWGGGTEIVSEDVPIPNQHAGVIIGKVIRLIGAEVLNRRPPAGPCRLFLGPGFRLGAR